MLMFIPDCRNDKKCVIILLLIMLIHQDLSPITIRPKKCVIRLSVLFLLQYNLFLIDLRLQKCDIAVNACPFVLGSVLDQFCLYSNIVSIDIRALKNKIKALKFVPDCFVTSKMIENLSAVFSNEYIFLSDLILILLHALAMIQTLIV